MADATTFRLALMSHLQAELGVEFLPGIITGPSVDRDIGCCWTVGITPFEDNALVAVVQVHARVLQKTPGVLDTPALVEEAMAGLEDLSEAMSAALLAIKYSLAGVWYFRVLNLEMDLEENGVEATLQAFRDNPAA